jgi:adenylate cyclase
MPKNLEIKARIQSIERSISVARSLGASNEGELHQTDTYFEVDNGRLKLREINQTQAELIYYHRIENETQRLSNFEIYPCRDPQRLKELLKQSIGIKAVVAKKRILYIYESTRIHIDNVEHLGAFIEFEAPVIDSEDIARRTIDFLAGKFEIHPKDYVIQSYIDLVLERIIAK